MGLKHFLCVCKTQAMAPLIVAEKTPGNWSEPINDCLGAVQATENNYNTCRVSSVCVISHRIQINPSVARRPSSTHKLLQLAS